MNTFDHSGLETRTRSHRRAYLMAFLHGRPEQLQNRLLADLSADVNDQYTRSALFWCIHRYFDNGGNIHETRKFFEKHEKLLQLSEVSNKNYPSCFGVSDPAALPDVYSLRSLYLLLSYIEAADQFGFNDLAGSATAMNQYAHSAYHSLSIPSDFPDSFPHVTFQEYSIRRSHHFQKKTDEAVRDIIDGKIIIETAPAADILVCLNQYAAGLRYLDELGNMPLSRCSSREIFSFAMRFAHTTVPELELFTSLLNATTLNLVPSNCTDAELAAALEPIFSFSFPTKNHRNGNIIDRILALPKKGLKRGVNIYNTRNVATLASRVPQLKEWLLENGWAREVFDNIEK